MGFLDNTGDIILDIVLTDEGRKRLSAGNGSFKITKFALGDEEINYALYNSSHASGSSYYDLEILQTPILESFTDNAASMKSQLVTYENQKLLYLPTLLLNELEVRTSRNSGINSFVVAVDTLSENDDGNDTGNEIGRTSTSTTTQGVLYGETRSGGNVIMIDTGINTTAISTVNDIPAEINETSFTIQIDSRFGSIYGPNQDILTPAYTDDDGLNYYVVEGVSHPCLEDISTLTAAGDSPIAGPRGVRLSFKIGSSFDLQTSTYLFTKLGSQAGSTALGGKDTGNYRYIDTIVRVTGMTMGLSMDIPVRFAKVI